MVVDTSVVLQILFREPGARDAVHLVANESDPVLSAATLLEAEIVYGARRGFRSRDVADLIDRLGITIRAFDADHAAEARLAYARFGKGQDHPARLNFGDCIAYGLAMAEGRELAYKGDDFAHTDVRGRRLG